MKMTLTESFPKRERKRNERKKKQKKSSETFINVIKILYQIFSAFNTLIYH